MSELSELQKSSVLLAFVEKLRQCGSWAGETHVQKAAYFLQELLRVPLGCKFVLYKHGPFSFDLRADLSGMQAWRFLALEPRGRYGPSLKAGERAEQLRKDYPEEPKAYAAQIEFVTVRMAPKGVKELEQIGTALYVTLVGNGPVDDRSAEIHRLKPHISVTEARMAVLELDQMRRDAKAASLGM